MKIAYLLEWEFDRLDGVIKKLIDQVTIWQNMGVEVKVFALSKSNQYIQIDLDINFYNKDFKSLIYHKLLYRDLKSFNPDIIYFRYSYYKPYLNWIFNNFISVVELNSNDFLESKLQRFNSIKDFILYLLCLTTHKYLISKTKGVVSVTKEIAKGVKKPFVVVPNSINLDSIKLKKRAKNSKPNLIFMGTPNQDWHGIDKIINLAKATQDRLYFHIIGIEKPNNLDLKNITFYGYLDRDRYKDILINCDIGIGTLSLYKKGMQEAAPLKVREYLAYGLPTIIGYKDSAFDKSFSWLLELENSKDNINNVDKIVDFCYKNLNYIVQKDEVRDYIDAKVLEKRRLDFLKGLIDAKV